MPHAPLRTDPAVALAAELLALFRACFGRPAQAAARAPGRVNLIGEHTDYNGGLAFPCAIDRHVAVAASPRDDGRLRVYSREVGETQEAGKARKEPKAGETREVPPPPSGAAVTELDPAAGPGGGWTDYVLGAWRVASEAAGRPLPGVDLAVASDLPRESGLSSSAALAVALVTVLDRVAGHDAPAEVRARRAHRVETEFVGLACGIMDPYASALGRAGHALRIDCRSLAVEAVPFPADLRILVADSGVRRRLVAGAYGDRRAECESALAAVRALSARSGRAPPASLRDLAPEDLPALETALADPVAYRRLRHVVTENRRVDACCAALRAGDAARAGALLGEGMRSLREDFEVSVPELDALCEAAAAAPGVLGSRLTGAGFGGCTIHLVRKGAERDAAERIAAGFAARFGRRPPVFAAAPADGAAALEPEGAAG